MRSPLKGWLAGIGLLAAGAGALGAGDPADALYGKYRSSLYQVRVIEVVSGKKTAIGSGFCVSTNGDLATNYHVVHQAILFPGRYRLECEGSDGVTIPLRVLDIDVIRDLAVARGDRPLPQPLAIQPAAPNKGTTLYALGNPLDLGMVIVSGTYNGLAEKSFHDKILFSGALNPGMSGGPAVDGEGRVVGVNVSTAGNDISFLVPAAFLGVLLDRIGQADPAAAIDLHPRIEEQLLDNQRKYLSRLIAAEWRLDPMGEARIPVIVDETMRTWGDTKRDDQDALYERTYMVSTSTDDIHISDRFTTGIVRYNFRWYVARELNPIRFYTLLEGDFRDVGSLNQVEKDDVTNFESHADFVRLAGRDWRVILSTRSYKKYPAIHDLFITMSTVSDNDRALLSDLWLTGVSQDMGLALARKFMESIQWSD